MMNKVNFTFRCNPIRGALCALLIGGIAPAFGQWVQVASGTTSSLKDIYFINDSVGFCVGGGSLIGFPNQDTAVVLRSLDGGETWSTVFQESLVAFSSVMAKGDTVVCFGRSSSTDGLLWSSYDNGTSWMKDTLASGINFGGHAAFLGPDVLYTSLQDLVLLDQAAHTTQTLFIPNNMALFSIDANYVYVVSMEKALYRSADEGLNWDPIPCILSDSVGPWQISEMKVLYVAGDTVIITGSYNHVFAYTTDLGLNWTVDVYGVGGDMEIVSLDTLYGYVNSSSIIVSTDRGVSSQVQQQLSSTVRKIFLLRGTQQGWVCGDNGMIYKTTNGGFATGVPDRMALPAQITIQPNPAHDRITMVVPIGMKVESIELLDSAMKRVRHFHVGVRLLNTQGLATGPYLLKINTDQGTQSIKVLLQ